LPSLIRVRIRISIRRNSFRCPIIFLHRDTIHYVRGSGFNRRAKQTFVYMNIIVCMYLQKNISDCLYPLYGFHNKRFQCLAIDGAVSEVIYTYIHYISFALHCQRGTRGILDASPTRSSITKRTKLWRILLMWHVVRTRDRPAGVNFHAAFFSF
jgi:hypothetical protein